MKRSLAMVMLFSAGACLADATVDGAHRTTKAVLDEVTVEGTRYLTKATVGGKVPLSLREIPSSVSVETRQRIEDQGLTTVADALSNVTGVTVIPNDSSQSQYKSRGYPIALMNDGLPAYNALSGVQQFDLAVYERLEVLRGPAGVLQGSGEPGGVLNVVRKRGREEFGASAALSAGSWDNYRATLDATGPLNADRSLRGRLVGVYHERDEFVDTTHSSRTVGYATVDWDVTAASTLSAAFTSQRSRTTAPFSGLPAAATGEFLDVPRSTHVAPDWNLHRWEIDDYLLGFTHRFDSGWTLNAVGSQRDQSQFFHDAFPSDGVRASDNTLPFVRREYDYDYRRRALDIFFSGPLQILGRSHTLTVGYNTDSLDTAYGGVALTSLSEEIRVPFDRPDLVPDFDLPYDEGGLTQTRQSGVYALGRFKLIDDLTFAAGLRASNFEVRSRNIPPGATSDWRQGNRVHHEITPYAGVVYAINRQLSAYASYADIFVPQSTQRTADGSPLKPRVGSQYEVGLKADFFGGVLGASAAAFRLRDNNRSVADPANPGSFTNAGEVESKGWEVEVSGSAVAGVELQAGYTRLDTQYVTASTALQGRQFDLLEPKHAWRFWALRRFNEHQPIGWTMGLGFNAQSEVSVDPKRSQPGYAVVSALIGLRINERTSINLNAQNLFDEIYYARIGGTNTYNTFGPPRSYSLTVRATF